ncbi:hypothetical protein J6590_035755 [Homalodisca vitripennis]|nr:hypothetical protein J6590_035755 [Homalodisca vitripennis]
MDTEETTCSLVRQQAYINDPAAAKKWPFRVGYLVRVPTEYRVRNSGELLAPCSHCPFIHLWLQLKPISELPYSLKRIIRVYSGRLSSGRQFIPWLKLVLVHRHFLPCSSNKVYNRLVW